MAYTRRKELTCTQEEFVQYAANTILYENEVIYVLQNDGSRKVYFGDGITALSDLNPGIDQGFITTEANRAETAQNAAAAAAQAAAESASLTAQAVAGTVKYNQALELSDAEKTQALFNINSGNPVWRKANNNPAQILPVSQYALQVKANCITDQEQGSSYTAETYTVTEEGLAAGDYYFVSATEEWVFSLTAALAENDVLVFDSFDNKLYQTAAGLKTEITVTKQPHSTETLLTMTSLSLTTPTPAHSLPFCGKSNVKIARTGINLLVYPYDCASISQNGATLTANDDGSVKITGTTHTEIVNIDFELHSVKNGVSDIFLPAGTYYLYNNIINSFADYGVFIRLYYFNKDGDAILFDNYGITPYISITLEKDTYVGVYLRIAPRSTVKAFPADYIFKPMLTTNSSTTWQAYEGQVKTFEPPALLWGLTDAPDSVTDNGTVTRNSFIYDITGEETIVLYHDLYLLTIPTPFIYLSATSLMCTHFQTSTSSSVLDRCYLTLNNRMFFKAETLTPTPDVSAFKAWLSEQYSAGNPVRLILPQTATNEEITAQPITALENTDKYNPKHNILISDADSLEVGYPMDSTAAYNELTAAITNLGGNE